MGVQFYGFTRTFAIQFKNFPVQLTNIKNLIFDLGGVIININYQLAADAFQKLSADGATIAFNQKAQSKLFDDYETGKITSAEFRDMIRREYHVKGTDAEIDAAWNAMLLDIPQERVELLQQLAKKYRIFLLSNTNAIHLEAFNKIIAANFPFPNLDVIFEKCYYSHLAGDRKPDAVIFERILQENNLNRAETLFIDDSIQHIESAQKLGIKTLHLAPPLTVNQAFADAV